MVGLRLKELRKEKGATQKVMAATIGVAETAVSMYETDQNDPSDNIKIKIAKYFDAFLDYLLGVIDDKIAPYSQEKFLVLERHIDDERELVKRFVILICRLNADGVFLLTQFMEFLDARRLVR